jgi:arylsulfatase A-like enzyme
MLSCTSPEEKPNVLFILADDLGWADLAYTGSILYETPNVDRLATEGMIFTEAYAACPVCSPSRAAILSGKYPARLILTDWIPGNPPAKDQQLAAPQFKKQLELEEITLAEAMKKEGYRTFFAGKWHLGEDEKYYPGNQGFDINIAGNSKGHPPSYFSPYKNPQLADGPEGEYLTDRLTDETIRFLGQNKAFPFLAFLSFYTPHMPLQGKPEKVEKYSRKLEEIHYGCEVLNLEGLTYHKNFQDDPRYAAMVESMDENIGRLLDTLEQMGIAENTIIIFTSDNGGMSTSGNKSPIPTSNFPLRAGKGYLYEGGIHEPLIIRWPGRIQPGRCSEPVTGTDFYPTILDLAGIELQPEQHVDGISLAPLLLEDGEIDREAIYWHFPHYSGGLGGRPSGAVRKGKYKLIEFYEDMHVELYDLETDIMEKQDISARMPEKCGELTQMLHRWREDVNAHMPGPNPDYEGH